MFKDVTSDKTILITKDWSCTKKHTYNTFIYIKQGDLALPQVIVNVECTQWTKN